MPARPRAEGRRARDRRGRPGRCSGRGGIWNWFDPLTVIRRRRTSSRAGATTSGSSSSACSTRTRTCREMAMAARRRRARGGARAARPRRLLQRGLGAVRASAARTCSRPTSASPRTSTTSRRASRSARACSTASGPACPSSRRAGDVARRARRASAGSAAPSRPATSTAGSTALDDAARRRATRTTRARARSRAVREEFVWPRVVEPLRRLVRERRARPSPRRRTIAPRPRAGARWRVRHAVADARRASARRGARRSSPAGAVEATLR